MTHPLLQHILLFGLVLVPLAGAFLVYLVGRYNKRIRNYLASGIAVIEFLLAVYTVVCYVQQALSSGVWDHQIVSSTETGKFSIVFSAAVDGFAGLGMHFTLDGFRCIFLLVITLMWMMTTIFSQEYMSSYRNRNRYYLFLLWTCGATVGVFLSADLFTTFLFFEMMSFTSYVWVAHDETKAALRAAQTYLAIAVLGGMVMLMGLFLLYHGLGTLTICDLQSATKSALSEGRLRQSELYVAAICIAVGFGAKAGAFPLHIWLPKAHPVAPAPTSALLSGILTKSGIFGILILCNTVMVGDTNWSGGILIIGTITMFLGAFIALFSIDLKRTLACSSMSQIGFILVGIGTTGALIDENGLPAAGSILHMLNHSLIKLVLFMVAGVIYQNIHALDLNIIRGFGRKKPLLHVLYLIGGLSIAGVPGFSGYISKTLLHDGLTVYIEQLECGLHASGWLQPLDVKRIEVLFLLSGAMTVAYILKLYIAIFVEPNQDDDLQQRYDACRQYIHAPGIFAIGGGALLLLTLGLMPHRLMERISSLGLAQSFFHTDGIHPVHYLSLECLKGAGISISVGILIYLLLIRTLMRRKERYINLWPHWLDLEDSIYRPILHILSLVAILLCRLADSLVDGIVLLLRHTIYRDRPLPRQWIEGNAFTYYLGNLLNTVACVRGRHHNHTVAEKDAMQHEYIHELALRHSKRLTNRRMIERTLSYGLMLFCIGLISMLIYLLV